MKFTDEDIAFMDSLNNTGVPESNIYFTAKHAQYIRNLDRAKVVALEAIYRRVFGQPKYSLCYHCSNDVMKLVLKLYDAQAAQPKADPFIESTPDPEPDKQDPGADTKVAWQGIADKAAPIKKTKV